MCTYLEGKMENGLMLNCNDREADGKRVNEGQK